jgi:predicted nucleotidyltransferase
MTVKNKNVRMKRSTADRLLKGVQERILEVNSNPRYCYRVTEAVVFGSYVNDPEKQMLGDLDIALDYDLRYPKDSEEYRAKKEECKSNDFIEYNRWPLEEVMRYIRNRSGWIQLTRLH